MPDPITAAEIQERDGVAVVVYSKPACVQCNLTKNRLDEKGIVYTTVDMTADPVALAYVKETLGILSAPAVVAATPTGDETWGGFRPDLIAEHITERKDES